MVEVKMHQSTLKSKTERNIGKERTEAFKFSTGVLQQLMVEFS